jgi:hypothetical protein
VDFLHVAQVEPGTALEPETMMCGDQAPQPISLIGCFLDGLLEVPGELRELSTALGRRRSASLMRSAIEVYWRPRTIVSYVRSIHATRLSSES